MFTFGQYGSEEGEFNYPMHVAVDQEDSIHRA